MYDIVGKRYWYFAISLAIIIPGVIAMIYSTLTFGTPIRVGIDFTGGSLWELQFQNPVPLGDVRDVFASQGFGDATIQNTGDNRSVLVRAQEFAPQMRTTVLEALQQRFGTANELRFDSVGPSVGAEVTRSATAAVVVASVLILIFIIFSFRRVPNSFRYGVCAIVAMIHDVLVGVGVFSILGLLFGWEADALFLTAILTVIGLSLQDTIVVFDRIRENVTRRRGEPLETTVNRSLLETVHRSVVLQLTQVFVLLTLLLFGGGTIRHFVTVLLYCLFSGMYSSIFTASPLLIVWENDEIGAFFRRLFGRQPRRATA